MDDFSGQLSIRNIVVSSWSKFALNGTGFCYQLDSFSDQSYRTLDESLTKTLLFCCLFSVASACDQTFQTKLTSDQTISRPWSRPLRPKLLLFRSFLDHRPDFRPDPVISIWEHTGVRSTESDHKPIWVWTSTWVVIIKIAFYHALLTRIARLI